MNISTAQGKAADRRLLAMCCTWSTPLQSYGAVSHVCNRSFSSFRAVGALENKLTSAVADRHPRLASLQKKKKRSKSDIRP